MRQNYKAVVVGASAGGLDAPFLVRCCPVNEGLGSDALAETGIVP